MSQNNRGQGRKRTPSQDKKLKGTWRADRVAPNEAEPMEGKMDFKWMGDPHVKACAERIAFYMRGEGRDSRSHELAVWLAAKRMCDIMFLDGVLKKQGRFYAKGGNLDFEGQPIVDPKTGYAVDALLRSHPAVAQYGDAMRQFQSLLSELGLTPASKSKVSVNLPREKSNPWNNFKDDPREAVQ